MEKNLTNDIAKKRNWRHTVKELGILWALIALLVFSAVASPYFLKSGNIINILRQISITGMVGIGMSFVIFAGGIDLSVGSIVGVGAVSAASLLNAGLHPIFAVLVALGCGCALGALNGFGVTKGKLAPFIMTLGTMTAARGLAMIIANGKPIAWKDTGTDFSWIGQGSVLGIPSSVWIYAAIFVIAFVVLKYTKFGRYVYAVGDNKEAARLSGINITRVEFMTYVIIGVLAGLSALVYASRLDTGEPLAGDGLELDAIAVVVIGGASMNGGKGNLLGTLIGSAIIAVLANILNLLGVSPYIQQITKGAIIVLAVLFERFSAKKN